MEFCRETVAEGGEVLADQRDLGLPLCSVNLEQLIKVSVGDLKAVEIESVSGGQESNGGVNGIAAASHSLKDPLEDSGILAVTGPEPLAVCVFAEPVDVENLWELRRVSARSNVQPVTEIVRHVVAAEGQHGEGVAAQVAHRTGSSSGGLRGHDRTEEHAVIPVA